MDNLFPADDPQIHELSRELHLVVPGGMRVPTKYPYIDTGDHLLEKCEAAWSTFQGDGRPLSFRLVGPPGVGKNAAVYALAARRKQPLYILLGHEELTAEDLVATAAMRRDGGFDYVASPLLAAMLNGGICFIDEIAKMRPRALAPLASLLDRRRTVDSALLGRRFYAKPDFRLCAAYNETDADAFDLAPWLRRRTLPELTVSRPNWDTLKEIVHQQYSNESGLYLEIERRAKERNIQTDAGTLLRLLSFAERLERLAEVLNIDVGDAVDVAFKHMQLVGEPKEGRE